MLKKILQALGLNKPKPDSYAEQVQEKTADSLEAALVFVASAFENRDELQARAQKLTSEFPYERAKDLVRYFHNTPAEPVELKSTIAKYGLLGVWMNIIQNTIFEILYQYKEKAIPQLYSIGFGEYDWTQYKAIGILARLAAEGIQTAEIVANIGKELPSFRYEAFFPSIDALARIKDHPPVAVILKQAFDEYVQEDPVDAMSILRLMAINYPQEAQKELPFLKQAAKGKGLENRSPLLDGALLIRDENGEEHFEMDGQKLEGDFGERHRINAALLYHFLAPGDPEIDHLLDHWEQHTDEEIRKIIQASRSNS